MNTKSYKHIPNSLRTYRKEKGLSQKQVAAYLGLKDNTLISRWENGESFPNVLNLVRLSLLYRQPFEILFEALVKAIRKEEEM
jgi:transcriptional regulator with XRE-family HTH domain